MTTTSANDIAPLATGDAAAADGFAAKTQDVLGSLRTIVADRGGPLLDRARGFARERPYATAALAGVVGLAVLNSLRGRG